jgi:hypothetical protein
VTLLTAVTLGAQTETIRPQSHTNVRNFNNPGSATDSSTGTFASAGLSRACSRDCTKPATATATFETFPAGYSPSLLEVGWFAFTAFAVQHGSVGSVTAKVEVDLGHGWHVLETHKWTETSPLCPVPSDQSITCPDHVSRLKLSRYQSTARVKARVTLTAQLSKCNACSTFSPANLDAQSKVYDVRITAVRAPPSKSVTRPKPRRRS